MAQKKKEEQGELAEVVKKPDEVADAPDLAVDGKIRMIELTGTYNVGYNASPVKRFSFCSKEKCEMEFDHDTLGFPCVKVTWPRKKNLPTAPNSVYILMTAIAAIR